MMHERFKNGNYKSKGVNAPIALGGGGLDFNFTNRIALRLAGDYLIAYVNGNVQKNFRLGAGLNIGL